jgi:hypothetical protein
MADRLQCEGVADSSMCPLVLGGLIYTLGHGNLADAISCTFKRLRPAIRVRSARMRAGWSRATQCLQQSAPTAHRRQDHTRTSNILDRLKGSGRCSWSDLHSRTRRILPAIVRRRRIFSTLPWGVPPTCGGRSALLSCLGLVFAVARARPPQLRGIPGSADVNGFIISSGYFRYWFEMRGLLIVFTAFAIILAARGQHGTIFGPAFPSTRA